MAGMSVSGLVSGLDTATIIKQLMQIEAMPQTALKNRAAAAGKVVSAFQTINSKLVALRTAAEKLTGVATATNPSPLTAWDAAKATSSSTGVTATATGTAQSGSVTFGVTQLAAAHFVATDPMAWDAVYTTAPDITITHDSTGETFTITPTATDIHSVVKAINDAGAGVRAAALQSSDGQYRLQITSATTGAASSFTTTGLVATPVVRAGTDAVIDLGAGVTVASATGTFTDVLPGAAFTVSRLETGVRVELQADTKATVDAVKAFVDAANAALTDISTHAKAVPGGTSGVLVGDRMARDIAQRILGNVSISGSSPADAGLSISAEGQLTLDTTKLEQLLASDPAAAQELVNASADRLATIAKDFSDPKTGTLTTSITRQQENIADVNRQVDAWDSRLDLRRANLERTYGQLEVALGRLQSQSSWLAGQIGSLPSWS